MPIQNNNLNSLDACDPSLNATVSASAGSGKTWLLITRIVRLLLDGAEPGNIIALTFTRKAAGEMQIRLNQRLFEMATAEDEALDEILKLIGCKQSKEIKNIARGLYEKLIHSLYPIHIQTFHSFCQDILSRFPLEADIPPGFDLLEDSSLVERQAWQALFSQAASQQQKESNDLSDALDTIMQACNGPDNTHTALHSFLSHRSDWWAYTAGTQKPVDFACNELMKSLQLESDASDPVAHFFDDDTIEKLLIFANLLREIKNKTSERHAGTIDDALNQLKRNKTESQLLFTLLKSAFIKKDGEALAQGRQYNPTLEKKLGEEKANLFVTLHNEIATSILQTNEQLNRLHTLKINAAWYYSGYHYIEIFQRLKREMRLLDFTDLEWKCYQLLQHADNAHWVQYKIDQCIDHLLIDEFQDTNPTQWNLLSPILEEIAANPEQRPRSIFLVGDEKQSIYSFRRANPALQAQASKWLAENLDAHATPLDFSRRSSSAIIDCVNQIFEQDEVKPVMTGYTTHDTYLNTLPGQVHLCSLFKEDEDEPDKTEAGTITFRNPLKQPREIDNTNLRSKEAENIAKQILRLKNTPEFVTKDTTVQPIEFGDILILMRNRTHVRIYEDALKQHGIPFIGSKKGGLLENLEIQDLSCLLNTLVAPYNNLSLAQVLKSPIFSASDDDLILLAQHGSTHWYERLLDIASTTEKQTSLSKPLRRAAKLLPRWQKIAEHLPVHDCLDKIFSQGNIINRYMAANKIENRQKVAANCLRFLDLSLETDSGRYPGITRFLQRLKHLETHSDSPPEEPLPLSDESRVRIMTIHGSKGLEAPIVFLVDCNSTPRNKNAYASLVRWPAEETRPSNFQLQLSKEKTDEVTQKLQQEKLAEQSREELNLLYVALTRAREQLYISGIENSKKQNNSWYQIIDNGLDSITELETSTDDISYKIYRHLAYDKSNSEQLVDKHSPKGKDFVIDPRLLSPIRELPKSTFMIAPSLHADETDKKNDTATVSPSTDERTVSYTSLAKWRGIMIHRVIEFLCHERDYPATQQKINDVKQRLQVEASLNHPAFSKHLNNCIDEAVTVYNHVDLRNIFNPEDDTKTYDEMPVMYKQDGQAVYGIIDRVIKTDDTITIIDYKSHRLTEGETIDETAKLFTGQFAFYQEGVKKIWPKHTIKTGVLFTHHLKLIWL